VLIGRDWLNDGIRGMKGEKEAREEERERENKNLLFGSHTQA